MNDSHTLKWRFDVSTFRLIGRDLITDRVTALFELIQIIVSNDDRYMALTQAFGKLAAVA